MSNSNDEVSAYHKDGAKARVADVLKSSLERGLIIEEDAVLLAGHGSHIVTQITDLGADARDEGAMALDWDNEKYRAFTERLTKLREGAGAL
jgi:hypothetical protein